MNRGQPIYGTISMLGASWTVHFAPIGSEAAHSLSGCGSFPREQFPDIPVVDFQGADLRQILTVPYVQETHKGSHDTIPLGDTLEQYRAAGAAIYYPGELTP